MKEKKKRKKRGIHGDDDRKVANQILNLAMMKNFKLKKSEDFFVSRDFVRGTEHIKKNFSKIKNYLTDLN